MLETTWFLLWGILWMAYFMLDGYVLGLGALLPILGRSESDKRIIYNSMGPFWDGNQVWLLAAGGVTFAAFPATYAVMFSGLYSALMLILFALILRGISIVYRGESKNPGARKTWDFIMTVGSFLPALLFGVAFANIFRGIPIDAEGVYRGTFLTLLNPYGLAGGLLFVLLFFVHGSLWLAVKSDGQLQQRAAATASKLWIALLVVAVIFLIATVFSTKLYINYLSSPLLFVIPLIAVVALLATRLLIGRKAWWYAWVASALTIGSATLFGVVGLYPNLLPSSLDTAYSMTIHNSASSELTLKIMLGVALTFVPIVIAYQVWVHYFFKDKATDKDHYASEA